MFRQTATQTVSSCPGILAVCCKKKKYIYIYILYLYQARKPTMGKSCVGILENLYLNPKPISCTLYMRLTVEGRVSEWPFKGCGPIARSNA